LPEVKELLDDEVKFQQFFESLAAVKEVKSLVTEMKRSNNELTEKNIALQQEIDDARSQLDAKQAAEADLRDRINQLHQLKTVIERVRTRTLCLPAE
jgi:predicted nuclease with TOPRIM domain